MDLELFVEGQKYEVVLMPRAYDDLCGSSMRPDDPDCSKAGLIGKYESSGAKNRNDVARLFTRIKKYADTGKLGVPEHLNTEGNGFFAFKAYQLRAYWWKSGRTIIISHFSKKKRNALSRKDEALMVGSRKEFEGSNHG